MVTPKSHLIAIGLTAVLILIGIIHNETTIADPQERQPSLEEMRLRSEHEELITKYECLKVRFEEHKKGSAYRESKLLLNLKGEQ